MTVYLSGPITGVEGYMENFERFESLLQSRGYKVVNPAKFVFDPSISYDEIMEHDIAELAKCDAIYLMPGWRNSKVAVMEMNFAREKNIHILVLSEYVVVDYE